jgi:hypothetical protein
MINNLCQIPFKEFVFFILGIVFVIVVYIILKMPKTIQKI